MLTRDGVPPRLGRSASPRGDALLQYNTGCRALSCIVHIRAPCRSCLQLLLVLFLLFWRPEHALAQGEDEAAEQPLPEDSGDFQPVSAELWAHISGGVVDDLSADPVVDVPPELVSESTPLAQTSRCRFVFAAAYPCDGLRSNAGL